METTHTHSSIEARQREIVEEFELFDDWMDKYEYIIALGKDLPLIDPKYKDDNHLIRGCQSQVWLHGEALSIDNNAAGLIQDGEAPFGKTLSFTADSDAIITKGLVSLMVRVLNNQPARAIAEADLSFIDEIGLHEHLSPTRSNGLRSMVKQMKLYGLAQATAEANELNPHTKPTSDA